MHPLTKLIVPHDWMSEYKKDVKELDKLIVDYLSSRANNIKAFHIEDRTDGVIEGCLELSAGKKCELCHGKIERGETTLEGGYCSMCGKYKPIEPGIKEWDKFIGKKPIEPKPSITECPICNKVVDNVIMKGDEFRCAECWKPKLPEKMEEDGGYPETALIAVINEVIEYLRGRE